MKVNDGPDQSGLKYTARDMTGPVTGSTGWSRIGGDPAWRFEYTMVRCSKIRVSLFAVHRLRDRYSSITINGTSMCRENAVLVGASLVNVGLVIAFRR